MTEALGPKRIGNSSYTWLSRSVSQTTTLSDDELLPFLRRRHRALDESYTPKLGPGLKRALAMTPRLLACDSATLLLDTPKLRGRSPLTVVGTFGPGADALAGSVLPSGEGLPDHVYRSGEPYVCADVTDDPLAQGAEVYASPHARSLLAVPIRLEQRVCGVVQLARHRKNSPFREKDSALCDLLEQYFSAALSNAVDLIKQNELAHTDDLTGLHNHRGLAPFVEQVVSNALTRDQDACVLFIDLDHLKAVNAAHGHRAGSEAIRRTGHIIGRLATSVGRAYRFGGDEFIVVCPHRTLEEGEALTEQIRQAVASEVAGPIRGGGSLPVQQISAGVASVALSLRPEPRDGTRFGERLMAAADRALLRAKRQGRAITVRASRRDDVLGKV